MNETKQKLTLDRLATYQIIVPGELDDSWSEWYGILMIVVESDGDRMPISTLTGTFDQAKLHSILRRLYSMGLPLISVICVDYC